MTLSALYQNWLVAVGLLQSCTLISLVSVRSVYQRRSFLNLSSVNPLAKATILPYLSQLVTLVLVDLSDAFVDYQLP